MTFWLVTALTVFADIYCRYTGNDPDKISVMWNKDHYRSIKIEASSYNSGIHLGFSYNYRVQQAYHGHRHGSGHPHVYGGYGSPGYHTGGGEYETCNYINCLC